MANPFHEQRPKILKLPIHLKDHEQVSRTANLVSHLKISIVIYHINRTEEKHHTGFTTDSKQKVLLIFHTY